MVLQVNNKDFFVDMWYGDKFVPKKYRASYVFYPDGCFGYYYRGNIYDDSGKIIGDYGTNDFDLITANFK